jgi:transposase-like protein
MPRAGRRSRRSDARQRRATRRWTRREAQQAVADWRTSGLSLPAWCRQEGVGYERVRRWRRQLASRSRRSQTATWLPVHVVESEPAADAPGFELELSRGLRLHVPKDFDEASLARLLRVVETSG